jgi:hypothetical protein
MTTARPPFGQKIVPIFWQGQAPTLGAEKLPHSVPKGKGKFFQGIFFCRRQAPLVVLIMGSFHDNQ